MKNLIIDPLVHFPTAYKMFADADYYCEDKDLPAPGDVEYGLQRHLGLTRADIKNIYDFEPVELSNLEDHYEKIIIVFPLNYIDDPGTSKWDTMESTPRDESEKAQKYFLFLKNLISKINYKNLIIIDGNDRATLMEGEMWLRQNDFPFDIILKREYRHTYYSTYPLNAYPFPFQTFGNKNPTWRFFEEKKKGSERVNGCFWSGGPIYHFPPGKRDEWCNRKDTLMTIQNNIIIETGIPQDEFMDRFNKYKSFLHLNGTGHLCARFFEGLSRDSLMIMEKMDTVFPFENRDWWHEECVFEYPLEFIEKINRILSDEKLYNECLDRQNYIVEKYYNYDWINQYVNSCLEAQRLTAE
tara:strand:- start:8666 stop:9730 length:1065 start_codon:yes stop_codon:yes gene_type:complete